MCCGKNRMQQRTPTSNQPRPTVYVGNPKRPPAVSFVNVGNTAMTVKGPISGREYRFDRLGARVEVDPRDRILLASIRQLRQVM